ncbi:MAG: hypothetical protein DMF78_00450 [Acidobacteria bacterium]|nr:MAG: hypothetical protein DMF78_00450 [Acidobacteriota bacterium]
MIPTGPSAGPRGALLLLALSVCPGLARSAAAAPPIPDPLRNIVALAPRELVTSNLRAPSGIAVTPSGRILFTDEKDGGLFEVAADAAARLLKGGLTKPRSVVWEEGERVLFLADGLKSNHQLHGLLLRFDLASGALTVLADGLKRPRALVRSDTAGVYLSSDGLRRPDDGEDDDEGDDCPPGIAGPVRACAAASSRSTPPEPFPCSCPSCGAVPRVWRATARVRCS